jgi:hypothetical protein
LQRLNQVVEGSRGLGLASLLDLVLFGVEDRDQALAIRDAVQAFIISAKS